MSGAPATPRLERRSARKRAPQRAVEAARKASGALADATNPGGLRLAVLGLSSWVLVAGTALAGVHAAGWVGAARP